MKIRHGFVSNSSSSSFVIGKIYLTPKQIRKIHNHASSSLDFAKTDSWNIHEDEFRISGSTSMDNFDMAEFLYLIGVDPKHIQWENY